MECSKGTCREVKEGMKLMTAEYRRIHQMRQMMSAELSKEA
jgi:hypothetical protein